MRLSDEQRAQRTATMVRQRVDERMRLDEIAFANGVSKSLVCHVLQTAHCTDKYHRLYKFTDTRTGVYLSANEVQFLVNMCQQCGTDDVLMKKLERAKDHFVLTGQLQV